MTTNVSKNRGLYNGLWYGGFWLLFTIWLRLALPESIRGWELHQLFRFSADYLTFFYSMAYPALLYIQAFFTQFYLYPLLGAAVIGGLLVLGMAEWHALTKQKWTGAVWAAFMLPLVPYFNVLWILLWLLWMSGGLLVKRLATWRLYLRYITLALMGFLSVLLLQENAVFAIVFWAVVYGVETRSWKGSLMVAGCVGMGVTLGVGLLFWKGYPYYYTAYIHRFILVEGVFPASTFPAIFIKCPLLIRVLSYIGLGLFMFLPLVKLGTDKAEATSVEDAAHPFEEPAPTEGATLSDKAAHRPENTAKRRNLKTLVQGSLGVLIGGLLIGACYLNLRYQAEDYYLVYRLTAEQRTAEALSVAETAFFQRTPPEERDARHRLFVRKKRENAATLAGRLGVEPISFQNPLEKEYMADALRVCLLNDKKATERLFFYSELSYFPLLFSGNVLHMPATRFIVLYYAQNGFYAEALHMLYDFVTVGDVNVAALSPLLWTSVVVKDYAPCRKFIRLFEQSLFRQDIAHRYTAYLADTAATDRQADIAAARLRLSSRNHTVMAYNPDDNIHFRLRNEANPAPFYEYALTLWMIYKNHAQILAELPKIRQYYPQLPRHVQEAVIANFMPDSLNQVPEDVIPDTKNRYIKFMEAYNMYMNGYISLREVKKNFGDTYWFHFYFRNLSTSLAGASNAAQI